MPEAQLTITSYELKCESITVYESYIDPGYVYISPSGAKHPIQVDDDWSFPTLTCIVTREEIRDYITDEDGDEYPIGTGKYEDVVSYVDPETGKEVGPRRLQRIKEVIQGVKHIEGEFLVQGPILALKVGQKYRFEDCDFPAPLPPLMGAFWVKDLDRSQRPTVRDAYLGPRGDELDILCSGRFVSDGVVEIQPLQAEDALTQ